MGPDNAAQGLSIKPVEFLRSTSIHIAITQLEFGHDRFLEILSPGYCQREEFCP